MFDVFLLEKGEIRAVIFGNMMCLGGNKKLRKIA